MLLGIIAHKIGMTSSESNSLTQYALYDVVRTEHTTISTIFLTNSSQFRVDNVDHNTQAVTK